MNEASPVSRRKGDLAAALALAVVAVVVHAGGLRNGFVWDDEEIIVSNPATEDLSRIGEVLLSPDMARPYYRPLTRASFLVDHALFGMSAAAFHGVGIGLHATCVAALYLLALRVSGRRAAAAFAAVLLAIHPLTVEAVEFVSARNNLLALLFSLLAILAQARALLGKGRVWVWISACAFLLGLLSKEQAAMTLPFLLSGAFLPVLPWRRSRREQVRLLAPHGLALAAYLTLRWIALGGVVGEHDGFLPGLPSRLVRDLEILPRYLGKALFPASLSSAYAVPGGIPVPMLALSWLAIGASVWLLLRRPAPLSNAGFAFFAWNLLPIAGIVPIPATQAMADRYFYVPAVGLWMVAGELAARLLERSPFKRTVLFLFAAVGVALAARTLARIPDWRDDVSLFGSAVAAEPASASAHFNLGNALRDRKDVPGARTEWERTLAIDPGHAGALTQLGTLAAVEGDLRRAESLYRKALASDPRASLALFNLAKVCERTGRAEEALALYREFLATGSTVYREYRAEAEQRLRELEGGPRAAGVAPHPPGPVTVRRRIR